MGLLEIGKITTTHGIKGEVKILSNLSEGEKEQVFKIGSHLHILGKAYEIKSHRIHKGLDMIVFVEFSNINDVLFMKGKTVSKDESELEFSSDMFLDSKLITFNVLTTDGKIMNGIGISLISILFFGFILLYNTDGGDKNESSN